MSDSSRTDADRVVERIGESCEHCSWTLTIEEVIRREQDRVGRKPTPERIRSKLGSLGEGHAYFNRGHRVKRRISLEEIEAYVGTEGQR
ncbi:hypothetical protein NDI85_21040 [Halomicroarcula sp. S1AR25-4]|uniref:hypothetical protein n=1 Tax=Haloarcula sp. S1AR25-4 TaxID=2950538 RepID=UPI0028746B96|nr:hypothetical protein [Halomicroarcula sp. S1AR25-4]MDS0280273.1 hypothetical protein [Halomicroarcula sp. S1AR25-4]